MKIKVDKKKCLGCGSCVALAPDVFEMNNDNIAQVNDKYSDVEISDTALIESLKIARDSCPNGAIVLE